MRGIILLLSVFPIQGALAATNYVLEPGSGTPIDTGASILRVFGALIFVIAVFLAAAWCFRHWGRISVAGGAQGKLFILECKSLGPRHAVYVAGYEKKRFLIASSPAGTSLLSELPDAEEPASAAVSATPTFMDILQRMTGKTK